MAAERGARRVTAPRTTAAGRIYAYLRVSTDAQELASQKVGIVDYARERSLRVDEWFEEKVSGTVDAGKRDLGAKLLPKLQAGDVLVVPELSRLGRTLLDVLGTLKQLSDRHVRVHVVKGAMVLDNSLNLRILSTVLSLAAEIEREPIRQRSIEGQARAKAGVSTLGGHASRTKPTGAPSWTSTATTSSALPQGT